MSIPGMSGPLEMDVLPIFSYKYCQECYSRNQSEKYFVWEVYFLGTEVFFAVLKKYINFKSDVISHEHGNIKQCLELGRQRYIFLKWYSFFPPGVTGFCPQYFARSTHNIPKKYELLIKTSPFQHFHRIFRLQLPLK